MADSRNRILTLLLLPLTAMVCDTVSAAGAGYGAFRPLGATEQSDPRLKHSQTFSNQNYNAATSAASGNPYPSADQVRNPYPSPQQAQESDLYGQLPTTAPGYTFRRLPSDSDTPPGVAKYRPDNRGGKSPYSWGGSDGNWSPGALGPAPLFRPLAGTAKERADKAAPVAAPPTTQMPYQAAVGGYPAAGYPVAPYPNQYQHPNQYQRSGNGFPFSRGGGFPMSPFSFW